jgi:hypothetical protein
MPQPETFAPHFPHIDASIGAMLGQTELENQGKE